MLRYSAFTRLPAAATSASGPSWTPGLEPSTKFWKTTRRWGRSSVIRPSGIFERLRDEHSYTGGYTIVKDYVRLRKLSQREMFVPLEHPSGRRARPTSAKRWWSSAVWSAKPTIWQWILPQSDDCFVMAFPAETTESLSGRTQLRLRLLRRESPTHDPVRQHQAGGGEDSG